MAVDVLGAYPDAHDPSTITVTAVVHEQVAVGRANTAAQASTVTIGSSPGGRLQVTAIR
ncbi:MAG TPA: hypothetical protein VEL73_02060 [Mycobacteriales bacterium]|nr:hypothetical protein [Mycobacteriales bacterium]